MCNPERTGDFRYEIIFKDLGETFERSSHRWSKLDPDSRAPAKLIDIPLVDLQKGSAWALEATVTEAIPDESRLPAALLNFARRIEIDGTLARNHGEPNRFIKFVPTVPLVCYDQKVAWTFNCIGSMYQVEIARTQHTDMTKLKMPPWPLAAPQGHMHEPRWSVSVRHDAWSGVLGSHANLKMGQGTSYPINMLKWFPKDHDLGGGGSALEDQDGFTSLMNKLGKIERAVRGEKL